MSYQDAGDAIPAARSPMAYPPHKAMPSATTLVVRIALLAVIFWLAILNARFPVLRFTSHWLNVPFVVVILFVPILALATAMESSLWRRLGLRMGLLFLVVPMLVFIVPATIVALISLVSGEEHLKTLEMHGYRIAAYRENCGAPCNFSVEVQQERTLIPPVMVVRHLRWFDDADEVEMEIVSGNQIRVIASGYNSKDPANPKRQTDFISLKRFIYF
jgi:hypothetical protein